MANWWAVRDKENKHIHSSAWGKTKEEAYADLTQRHSMSLEDVKARFVVLRSGIIPVMPPSTHVKYALVPQPDQTNPDILVLHFYKGKYQVYLIVWDDIFREYVSIRCEIHSIYASLIHSVEQWEHPNVYGLDWHDWQFTLVSAMQHLDRLIA